MLSRIKRMTIFVTPKRTWRVIAGARRKLYAQIGLTLIDELTGRAPVGRISSHLYIDDGQGGWRETNLKPVVTSRGALAFPEVESHRPLVAGQPARQYRVQIEAEFYRPFYRTTADGIDLNIFPYNDDQGPLTIDPQQPVSVKLAPATNYPFPSHVTVIRGVVKAAGVPVADAEVSCSNVERVVTDERGNFGLPIRNKPKNTPFPIDATDHRTNKTGNTSVKIPNDVGKNVTINIS